MRGAQEMNKDPAMEHRLSSKILPAVLAVGAVCAGLAVWSSTRTASGGTHEPAAPAVRHDQDAATVLPAEAMTRLVDGNARFVSGRTQHPRQGPDRRTELANTQKPFAVVLGCADSRTGPEILFDQGLGDIFVVREAGNVVDDHTLGGIEYAVEHLHVQLIVVLGHERCGAIAASRDTVAAKGHAEGHVASIVASIRPAVEATAGQDPDSTCKANVRNMVHVIETSEPVLKGLAGKGEVKVVGAYYDLDTGVVTFLDDR
jgi:carbonic anhydrase